MLGALDIVVWGRTVLDQHVLVVDNRDIVLGQIFDLTILDLPKLLRNLRDKTWTKGDLIDFSL